MNKSTQLANKQDYIERVLHIRNLLKRADWRKKLVLIQSEEADSWVKLFEEEEMELQKIIDEVLTGKINRKQAIKKLDEIAEDLGF